MMDLLPLLKPKFHGAAPARCDNMKIVQAYNMREIVTYSLSYKKSSEIKSTCILTSWKNALIPSSLRASCNSISRIRDAVTNADTSMSLNLSTTWRTTSRSPHQNTISALQTAPRNPTREISTRARTYILAHVPTSCYTAEQAEATNIIPEYGSGNYIQTWSGRYRRNRVKTSPLVAWSLCPRSYHR